MTAVKDILDAGLAIQTTALLGENVKIAKKKKKRPTDMTSLAAKNIVGASLLRAQAQSYEGL